MKKVWNVGKYFLILGVGIALARFVFFRNSVKLVSVRTISSETRKVKQTISASGEVMAEKSATLSFPLAGTLASLDVAEGDSVTKGATIASVSSADAYYSVEAARDTFDAAKRDIDLYIENYDTNPDAVGGRDEYEIQLRKYRELADKAEATYKSTQQSYYKNFLTAPFEGVVIKTYIEEGETVSVATPVVKIADPKDLYFEITVDQEDFGKISLGQEVEIELDAYEDSVFAGEVSKLPAYANGGDTPSFTVEIKFAESATPKVLLGMTGDAEITVASTSDPVSALLYDEVFYDANDKAYVWTVNDLGNLKRDYVEVGLEGDLYTEIKSDLPETLVIPLEDDAEIEEGFKAKITNE
ncbi:efflux RND transporter periplasmic adaptor subunit [candidate division WWE3 bacterium]|nr:efflux RND transporter periplasmic adaptor subunit [candidate division WWE3 bacterium]